MNRIAINKHGSSIVSYVPQRFGVTTIIRIVSKYSLW